MTTQPPAPPPAVTDQGSEDTTTGVYGQVHDPTRLQVVATELFAAIADLDTLAAATAERPDTALERAAGVQHAKALLLDRVKQARRRLRQLTPTTATTAAARPTVHDPTALPAVQSRQGQPLNPVITRPTVATTGLSSAEVWMPPGHAAHAHVHHDTDVIVIVRDGQAVTLWWDHTGQLHEIEQRAGQHLHIPRGIPHAAINRTTRPVIATETRSSPWFDHDNHRLPALDPTVEQRAQPLPESA